MNAAILALTAVLAQSDLSDLLERLGKTMDDTVNQFQRATRRGTDKPTRHLEDALEGQRDVLRTLEDLLKAVEGAPN
jgi:hypothetical protein